MTTVATTALHALLHAAAEHAAAYLAADAERPVRPDAGSEAMREAFGGPLPARGEDPGAVLARLVERATPGLLGITGPRFFGFVVGGALPAALAADWMASAWDQNTGLAAPTPATSTIEEVAGGWLKEVLGLPADASFAFVTGCQMAHVTALAAARHRVLADAGWDVERDGLAGAPRIRVLAGAERHVTLDRALRFLGLGAGCVEPVEVDAGGAMRADALRAALAGARGPVIVCAQAGNVNTGAVDPLGEIADLAHAHGAWAHVDGAFGLWAAAAPARAAALTGADRADSWATDAHKWLNVPYDSGLAFVADAAAHRAAMAVTAEYLVQGDGIGPRDPLDFTPEFSRRARGLAVWAALRSLGREGVAELVERLCACAERFAAGLRATPGAEVLAQGLNQVLVRATAGDAATTALVAALQDEGTCYPTGTVWRGRAGMRLSVCNWQTTAEDVDRSLAAIRARLAAM